MNYDTINERTEAVFKLIAGTKAIIDRQGLSRPSLAVVLRKLDELAAQRHWWGADLFPNPKDSDSISYRVAEDDVRGFTLYLDVANPGKKVPPHNYTTWACIAAVEGREDNLLYERGDDGSVANHACLRRTSLMFVEPGNGIALMPDDIHAIANSGRTVVRHLHFYGRPLEALTGRLQFDLEKQTVRAMPSAIITRI